MRATHPYISAGLKIIGVGDEQTHEVIGYCDPEVRIFMWRHRLPYRLTMWLQPANGPNHWYVNRTTAAKWHFAKFVWLGGGLLSANNSASSEYAPLGKVKLTPGWNRLQNRAAVRLAPVLQCRGILKSSEAPIRHRRCRHERHDPSGIVSSIRMNICWNWPHLGRRGKCSKRGQSDCETSDFLGEQHISLPLRQAISRQPFMVLYNRPGNICLQFPLAY